MRCARGNTLHGPRAFRAMPRQFGQGEHGSFMESQKIIYHIVTVHDLKTRTVDGCYKPANFDECGFIHCAAGKDTALLVLKDYFSGISDADEILILEIDVAKLKSGVQYEPPAPIQGGGSSHLEAMEMFPHIYGLLNIDAVLRAGKVERVDGGFIWPRHFAAVDTYVSMRTDWDPHHYLQFGDERTQPSIDLVNRIDIGHYPANIVDVGCGPGNSSQVLLRRWPDSNLVGIDNSPAMIEKAKKDYPAREWLLVDAVDFQTDVRFDIVFSNAAIQWIPDHRGLLKKFYGLLSGHGAMAVQLPKFQDMALGGILQSVSGRGRWKNRTEGCSGLFTYHDYHYYYDLLSDTMKSMDMWETDYIHVMPSHASIVDWIKSTGMKPYLDRIGDENDKKDFEREVLDAITGTYPRQKNGNVLFPFKRLFFIGYR